MADTHTILPATALKTLTFLTAREQKALHASSLDSVSDLLRIPPRRYEDRRTSPSLATLPVGENVCLPLRIYSAEWRVAYKRYYEVGAGDPENPDGPRIMLRWYNMPYIARLLAIGMQLSVYGKLKYHAGQLVLYNPDFEVLNEEEQAGLRLAAAALGDGTGNLATSAPRFIHTGRIVPIYRALPGISARGYRELIYKLLSQLSPEGKWEDYDSAPSYPMHLALRDLHFPPDEATAHKARLRFALSECFARQFAVAWRRSQARSKPGQITVTTDYYCRELLQALPFQLTAAQQRCIAEIRADMSRPIPMNRLLQGDVGSGKTLVALYAMLLCVESGKTAALIAPTQILAEQHYQNFCRLLRGMDIRISLRTAGHVDDSDFVSEPGCGVSAQRDSQPRLLIGTHTLLYPKNRPSDLGLAVIDEQHKFGVMQRETFIRSGKNPDVLVMTATPIPRTLTLTIYGDLDVSIIDELPPNRGQVVTVLRNPRHMQRIIKFLRNELKAGRQTYIISPLIEKSEISERAAATAEAEHWRELIPEASIGLLHGRMPLPEKEAAMRDFYRGDTQVLVATTVVEVGVDVPNATVMLINDASSFGLSQLHQLRGRIGRGSQKSYCILLSEAPAGDPAREKLLALCSSSDGFEIAEYDLRLRGPGDVFGTVQSGLSAVNFPEWLADTRLIYRANDIAQKILRDDPNLIRPEHHDLLMRMQNAPRESITS